jgi:hypothetical protein
MEASGHARWFERLLEDPGDDAQTLARSLFRLKTDLVLLGEIF